MARLPSTFALRRLIPNMLTLLALASGMSALRYTLLGEYDKTIVALVAACIFDVLDGGIARMLGTSSKFGAELDSLSDVICFGVTPSLTLYLWALNQAGSFGWLAALCFTLCCALRLARFNVMADDENTAPQNPRYKKFFVGSPTPGTTGLALLPLIAALQWPEAGVQNHPKLIAFWVFCLALLMVSRVPTLALKGWKVPHALAAPIMLFVGLIAAGLVTDTWATLLLIGAAYIASMPVALVLHTRAGRQAAADI